ncbi:AraC family transcriptional regulator [Arthrobacter crystallopoietes]|uniref:AraC family transcriptional regulator n=1 Tax=Crystallibacter crystallopoietes TaxID=37928 RepID=UPI003D19046E
MTLLHRDVPAPPPPTHLLAAHPLLRSDDPAQIRSAVNDLTADDHRLTLHQGRRLDGTVNGLRVGDLSMVLVAYGAQLTVQSPPSGRRVLLVFPLGPMLVECGGHTWMASTPFALSSERATLMEPDPVKGALVGSVDVAAIEGSVAGCFGAPLNAPLALTGDKPLQLAAAGYVTSSWLGACQQFDAEASDTLTGRALSASLLSSAVVGLAPHLQLASGKQQPSGPSYLREARGFVEQRYAEPLTVERIAAAVRISPRQLQAVFTEHLGSPPSQLLRNIRLDRARELLSDRGAAEQTTVATAATRVGFTHLGRFSAYYTQRFGESPSATLAKTRG